MLIVRPCGLADDVPFVLRIIVQSMLPGTPADLQAEAQTLSTQIQAAIHSPTDVSMSSLGLDELCPACHAVVPLQDVTTATCPNGHVWRESSSLHNILPTADAFLFCSTVLGHVVRPRNAHGPHLHKLQPQSLPSTTARRARPSLAPRLGAQLGRPRAPARRTALFLLRRQLRHARLSLPPQSPVPAFPPVPWRRCALPYAAAACVHRPWTRGARLASRCDVAPLEAMLCTDGQCASGKARPGIWLRSDVSRTRLRTATPFSLCAQDRRCGRKLSEMKVQAFGVSSG